MIHQYRYEAGCFSVSFSQFTIKGTDALSFLQAQSTYDVKSLEPQSFHLISLLDIHGKIESYGWLLREESHFTYLVPLALETKTDERLNRYLISEDVEINSERASWNIIVGENSQALVFGFKGKFFADRGFLTQESPKAPVINEIERELWRKLTGWPSFSGDDFSPELLNNTLLFDQSLSAKKGCYPGQETVSKIATHRGAAFSPVLLEASAPLKAGALLLEGKKIGDVTESLEWEGKFYHPSKVLRDFRVENLKLTLPEGSAVSHATVKYYPLIKGEPEVKARELFHLGSEKFRDDLLDDAESAMARAIEIDPRFADAYESLGVMLGRRERYQEAIELMQRLAEVDPDSVMAHTNMSLYLMKLGRIEEAEHEKSQATLKSFKKFGAEAQSKRQAEEEIEKRKSEWAQRENLFQQVLEIDPEDTLANYGLGSIAVERGDWDKARLHLEKVLLADPKYSVAYLALGKTYKSLGLKDKAKETFSSGIKVAASRGDLMPANQMQMELEQI